MVAPSAPPPPIKTNKQISTTVTVRICISLACAAGGIIRHNEKSFSRSWEAVRKIREGNAFALLRSLLVAFEPIGMMLIVRMDHFPLMYS